MKTDKSHKLCIMDIDKYKEMGLKHTSKDMEVTWDEVMVRQRKITGLTRCLSKALGVGESWGERNAERCKEGYHIISGVVPILKVTPKDHKPLLENGCPKARPIFEASISGNSRLSDLLSDTQWLW